jgi:signal transduction histidine kinase/ligand-binding sensor domain-containing protein
MVVALLNAIPIWSNAASTNSSWFYRAWQTEDGLPANSVTGIAQAPEGRLWLTTHSGLATFDGIKFSSVSLPLPLEREHPLIRTMLLGRRNDLWLALEGGIVVRFKEAGTRVFTTTNGLPVFRPLNLAQVSDDAAWISFVDGSVCRITDAAVTRFRETEGLIGVGPCALAGDSSGKLWFAKAGHAGVFHAGKFISKYEVPPGTLRLAAARSGGVWICAGLKLLRCFDETNGCLQMGEIHSERAGVEPAVLFEDRSGLLWIGTQGEGLFCFDGQKFNHVNSSHSDVLALAQDREENIWVGTDGGGVNRLRTRLLELHGTDSGLPLAIVRSLCEDSTGCLWAAAQNGEVARLKNPEKSRAWERLTASDGWTGGRATCITGDRAGGVWIGTYHGGLHHWDGTNWTSFQHAQGLAGEVVRALLLDSKENLWISMESTTCVQRLRDSKFQTFSQPVASRAVCALAEDANGNIWCGTLNNYLLRVEGDQLVDETPRTLAIPKPIRSLYATPDGSLWLGYAGAGVGRFKNGHFTHIASEQGLPDAFISAMVADTTGGFWFASDHGIFQVSRNDLEAATEGRAARVRAVPYGRDEGFPNLQANHGYCPNAMRSRDGRIWFPMRTGLAVLHPDRTLPDRVPPPVSIERVVVDGRPVSLAQIEQPRLPPGHKNIEFDFTAFTFIAPEHVTFKHRLEGWDDNWLDSGTERHVNYTRLPAGPYKFHVSARGSMGDWNPVEAAVTFTVEPFIWQRWWFRAACIAVFTGAIVGAARFVSFRNLRLKLRHLEHETVLQKERARIAKDIHDDLGASLTQISFLSKLGQHDSGERAKVAEHLKQIAFAARVGVKAVDEIVWAVNPRNDTLAHLLDYAGQFAVDFLRAAGIHCRVDLPETVPPHMLPADVRHGLFLVIKEALNNVAKHSSASEVWIRARVEDSRLNVAVEDNGRGFVRAPDNALSDGLRNMQERMAELGGNCRLETIPGAGAKVLIELSLAGIRSKRVEKAVKSS